MSEMMIELNLLPEELRVKKEKTRSDIPYQTIGIAVGALFLVLTLFFYFGYLGAKGRMKDVNAMWLQVQPQHLELNALQQEVEGVLKTEKQFMEKFVTTDYPVYEIMMWASEYIPDTTWIEELKVEHVEEGSIFLVKGLTLPSKEISSIEYIEEYLNQLKAKMPNVQLSLTTTRKIIEGVELTEFTAIFSWGGKSS